jgi:hypothetical protein
MALIAPTTIMMHEAIMQSGRKWTGVERNSRLGLRHSSMADFVLGCGEPVFELDSFLLKGDEIPEKPHGDGPDDRYQSTEGVARWCLDVLKYRRFCRNPFTS